MPEVMRKQEIEQNFHAFQAVVASYLPDREGEYALLHNKQVVSLFSVITDALIEGDSRFGDGNFSVQRVTGRSIDLGFLSYASDDRLII